MRTAATRSGTEPAYRLIESLAGRVRSLGNSVALPPGISGGGSAPADLPVRHAARQGVRSGRSLAWLSVPANDRATERALEGTAGALAKTGRVSGGAIHDARVAAICLEHGVRELWSADRDFGRLPGIAVRNPLVAR